MNNQLTVNKEQRKEKKGREYIACYLLFFLCSLFTVLCACDVPQSNLPEQHKYDPDLDGWKAASWSPFTVADYITDITYGGGLYIAVSATGIIAWSQDGDIWHKFRITSDSTAQEFHFNTVCYGDGVYIAAGNDGIFAYSDNGKDWTGSQLIPFGANEICSVAYGDGYFVAVGDNSYISCSSDGKLWFGGRNASLPANIKLNDVAFDSENNRFYLVGNGGHRAWTDNPKSLVWNHKGPEHPVNNANITRVTIGKYGDNTGIGIVYDRKTAIATNIDFVHFDADVETFLFNGNAINGIAWGGGFFVAGGTSAMIGYWPSDEPSRNSERYWRALTIQELRLWEISVLKACNGRFFAGNAGGKIIYSK